LLAVVSVGAVVIPGSNPTWKWGYLLDLKSSSGLNEIRDPL